jgi:hypothetical protein
MKPILINSISYTTEQSNDDILLIADDHSMVIENGWQDMKHLGILECRYNVRGLEDEEDNDYDEDLVNDWIESNIDSWVEEHFNEAKLLNE